MWEPQSLDGVDGVVLQVRPAKSAVMAICTWRALCWLLQLTAAAVLLLTSNAAQAQQQCSAEGDAQLAPRSGGSASCRLGFKLCNGDCLGCPEGQLWSGDICVPSCKFTITYPTGLADVDLQLDDKWDKGMLGANDVALTTRFASGSIASIRVPGNDTGRTFSLQSVSIDSVTAMPPASGSIAKLVACGDDNSVTGRRCRAENAPSVRVRLTGYRLQQRADGVGAPQYSPVASLNTTLSSCKLDTQSVDLTVVVTTKYTCTGGAQQTFDASALAEFQQLAYIEFATEPVVDSNSPTQLRIKGLSYSLCP